MFASPCSSVFDNQTNPFPNFLYEYPSNIFGVEEGDTQFGDFDSDGDLDFLISGKKESLPNDRITRIFVNDNGTFIETNPGLWDMWGSNVEWGDFDADGDLDLLHSGSLEYLYEIEPACLLYRNSNGIFTDIGAGFYDLTDGGFDWGDYDNDGDLDLIVSAGIHNYEMGGSFKQTVILKNYPGGFIQIMTNIPGTTSGSVRWGDYDNDGDLDVLITGDKGIYDDEPIANIYENNNGSFVQKNFGFSGVIYGSGEFADFDNDGDLDVAISGELVPNYNDSFKIYRNDNSVFTNIPGFYNSFIGPLPGGILITTAILIFCHLFW